MLLNEMAVIRKALTLSLRIANRPFVERGERRFSVKTSLLSAYDPDGKTTVNILNNEEHAPMMINGYSPFGFRLNNGIFVVGPVAMFPRTVLSWNVRDDNDVNGKSLSLFFHLAPKLDLLVIGLSDSRNHKLIMDVRNSVLKMLSSLKQGDRMNVEVLPTEKAVTTFNFLNGEHRFVGAALIPPIYYTPTLDDEYRTAFLNKKREKGDYLLE